MKTLLFIAAGGAFGALGRHGVNSLWLRTMGADFPGGTMIVNTDAFSKKNEYIQMIDRKCF